MTKIFFDVLWFVAGLALALPLGLLAMRLMRRANPKGTMAVASALMLFLSPYFFDTRGQSTATHSLKLREFFDPDGNALALMGMVAK